MAEPKLFDFNSDQVFSYARQFLSVAGAMLLIVLPQDITNVVIALVPMAVSVIWSMWRNADNMLDMLFSFMRQAVLIVGALAVARGWVSDQWFQFIAGTGMAAVSSMLSMWFYRAAPGPELPGTTIVDE